MIKFLISLGSLLVCLGILVLGGFLSLQTTQINEITEDFNAAVQSTPNFDNLPHQPTDTPDRPGSGNEDKPDDPNNPGGGNNDKPIDPDSDFVLTIPDGSDAIIDMDTILEVDEVEDELSASIQKNVDYAIGKDKDTELLAVYDIELVLDGATVQPGGLVMITLPAPENAADHESLQVVYIDSKGNVSLCDTTVNSDGSVSFLTDHFSRYAIVGVAAHTHKFFAGKCECGETDPNYVPPHVHKFVDGVCECGESDPNYVPPHVHKYIDGVCECGEVNPNYKPEHTHVFVDGKCECGDTDPNYVPPHVHRFIEGVCECGERNPNYVPPHVHEFVDGKCECGEKNEDYKAPGLSTDEAKNSFGDIYDTYDPEFSELKKELFLGMVSGALGEDKPTTKPEHTHTFINGKCECGEVNPNYKPDHTHVFVDGKCECGDTDPNYVPPHVHKFVDGVCECGEIDPNYNKPIDPDFGDGFDAGFDEDFNPDDYVPEEAPEGSTSSETVNELIIDVSGTYFEKLQDGVKNNIEANSGASAEEQQIARDEFVQKESEAFAGLLNVVTKPEETTNEQLVESVDAILGSTVCLETVTESVDKNDTLTSTVQDATSELDIETKKEIQSKIEEQLAANPENEKQYNDLANLFGITLGSEIVIPDDVVIPEA